MDVDSNCRSRSKPVMNNNPLALRAYKAAGFMRHSLQEDAGAAIFLSKSLY